MESFVGTWVAGILFLVTLTIALVVYSRNERRRKESSFFSTEFRWNLLGAESLFGVVVVGVGLLSDLYITNGAAILALLVGGTVGQYYAHERIIRWAHRLAGEDRAAKGTHPRRHRRAEV